MSFLLLEIVSFSFSSSFLFVFIYEKRQRKGKENKINPLSSLLFPFFIQFLCFNH
ncbi:hypothetical protein F4703DRAFT_1848138 [Phycomyces blakesleeanus]